MTEKEKHLKAASVSMIVGIGGALGVMVLAAWLSYVIRGNVAWQVMLPAGFGAVFHFVGCLLFVNYFKTLAANDEGGDDG